MAALTQDAGNLIAGITYLQAQVRSHEPQFADALCAAVARYNEDQTEVASLRTRLTQIGDNRRLQSSCPPVNPGWLADYRAHLKEELVADVLRAVMAARGPGVHANSPSWIAASLAGVLEGWGRLVGTSGATPGGPPKPPLGEVSPTPGGPAPVAPTPVVP